MIFHLAFIWLAKCYAKSYHCIKMCCPLLICILVCHSISCIPPCVRPRSYPRPVAEPSVRVIVISPQLKMQITRKNILLSPLMKKIYTTRLIYYYEKHRAWINYVVVPVVLYLVFALVLDLQKVFVL